MCTAFYFVFQSDPRDAVNVVTTCASVKTDDDLGQKESSVDQIPLEVICQSLGGGKRERWISQKRWLVRSKTFLAPSEVEAEQFLALLPNLAWKILSDSWDKGMSQVQRYPTEGVLLYLTHWVSRWLWRPFWIHCSCPCSVSRNLIVLFSFSHWILSTRLLGLYICSHVHQKKPFLSSPCCFLTSRKHNIKPKPKLDWVFFSACSLMFSFVYAKQHA